MTKVRNLSKAISAAPDDQILFMAEEDYGTVASVSDVTKAVTAGLTVAAPNLSLFGEGDIQLANLPREGVSPSSEAVVFDPVNSQTAVTPLSDVSETSYFVAYSAASGEPRLLAAPLLGVGGGGGGGNPNPQSCPAGSYVTLSSITTTSLPAGAYAPLSATEIAGMDCSNTPSGTLAYRASRTTGAVLSSFNPAPGILNTGSVSSITAYLMTPTPLYGTPYMLIGGSGIIAGVSGNWLAVIDMLAGKVTSVLPIPGGSPGYSLTQYARTDGNWSPSCVRLDLYTWRITLPAAYTSGSTSYGFLTTKVTGVLGLLEPYAFTSVGASGSTQSGFAYDPVGRRITNLGWQGPSLSNGLWMDVLDADSGALITHTNILPSTSISSWASGITGAPISAYDARSGTLALALGMTADVGFTPTWPASTTDWVRTSECGGAADYQMNRHFNNYCPPWEFIGPSDMHYNPNATVSWTQIDLCHYVGNLGTYGTMKSSRSYVRQAGSTGPVLPPRLTSPPYRTVEYTASVPYSSGESPSVSSETDISGLLGNSLSPVVAGSPNGYTGCGFGVYGQSGGGSTLASYNPVTNGVSTLFNDASNSLIDGNVWRDNVTGLIWGSGGGAYMKYATTPAY